jgi:hypothetical protein
VKEKFIRRMTSSNSSLSIETSSEVKSVNSLREPLVSIAETGQRDEREGNRQKKKKSNCILCCVLS